MTAPLPHIVGGIGKAGGRLLGADLLDDLPRNPHHKGIVRDDLAFRHQRTGPDDAVFAHNTVVEQGGVHPDQGTVSHGAPVDKGTVAHGHIFAQRDRPARVTVEHRIVLHIGVLAQGQGAVVPAQNRAIPDRGARPQHHITQHRGVGCHEHRTLVPGNFSTKRQQHCEKPPFSFPSFMVFFYIVF